MPAEAVDVNVHPTKEEVTVLHQDAITAAICDALRDLLIASEPIRSSPKLCLGLGTEVCRVAFRRYLLLCRSEQPCAQENVNSAHTRLFNDMLLSCW